MSRIFISHASADSPAALAIAQWLTAHGWDDYFLDFSSDRGLAPGERWQEALKLATDRCEAVIFLISPSWVSSRWCLTEFLLAKQLGKAIFGVLIDPTPFETLPADMAPEWQLCDLVNGAERETFVVGQDGLFPETQVSFALNGLARLRHGLKRAGIDAATFPWPPPGDLERAPYRGLRALDREDAAVFFGRDATIVRALDTLRRLRQVGTGGIFVILGASGAGKSSFLRAGLLPRLARDDRLFFTLPIIRPERAPMSGQDGLLASLEIALRKLKVTRSRSAIRNLLEQSGGFVGLLCEIQRFARERLATAGAAPPTLLLPIDQAEEIFDSDNRGESERLLTLLGEATGREVEQPASDRIVPALIVLAAIRSDSFEGLQQEPLLAHTKRHIFDLSPIPAEEYKAIIEGPAARRSAAGRTLHVDPVLTEQLLKDTKGTDALPLLAFTLERLLIEHGGDGLLTLADYEDLGGVGGSIEAAIVAAFAYPTRPPEVPADTVSRNRLLRQGLVPWLALVDPDTDERKRRVARWDEIPTDSRPLLERLIEQRLLVRDERELAGSGIRSTVVEVAHEALLRRWSLLTSWLNEDADALKSIDVARRAAAEWVKNARRPPWLAHTGDRLHIVEGLLLRLDLGGLLGDDGRTYVRACRQRDDATAERAAAQERQARENERRALAAEKAAEQERLALAEAKTEQAFASAKAARTLSQRTLVGAGVAVVLMLIAASAAVIAFGQQRAAEQALGVASMTEAERRERSGLAGQSLPYLARAVRLDPSRTAWRAALASALIAYPWLALNADIRSVDPTVAARFSPDGTRLLTVAGDEASLWDPLTGARIGSAMRHRNTVNSAVFSPDGRWVVTASVDRTARVWDAATGAEIGPPLRHNSRVLSAAFTADSRRVLTATSGGERLVFDAASGRSIDTEYVAEAESQPNTTSASARLSLKIAGREVRVTDVRRGQSVAQPVVAGDGVFATDLNPDGIHLVTVSPQGARTWDTRTSVAAGETLSYPQPADNDETFDVDFDPLGASVAVWADSTINVRDAHTGQIIGEPLNDARDEARPDEPSSFDDGGRTQLEFSRDGARILVRSSGGDDSAVDVVRIYRLGSSTAFEPIRLPFSAQAQLSGDGRLLITTHGKSARIWNVDSGRRKGKLLRHRAEIAAVALSPDGRRIATGSSDGTARVWSSATGEAVTGSLRHNGGVKQVMFSGDGARLLAVVSIPDQDRRPARQVRVWDAENGDATGPTISHADDVTSVALSPDGERVLTTFGTVAQVWDTRTGARAGEPMDHEAPVVFGTFDPEGQRVLTLEGRVVRLWDAERSTRIGEPMRETRLVRSASFLPDGQRVLVQSRGTEDDDWYAPVQASIWDTPTGTAQDAELLADAAEALSGYRVTELGTLEPLSNPGRRLADLRASVSSAQAGESPGRILVRWLLTKPTDRTIAPFAQAHVNERLKRALNAADKESLDQLYLLFPDDPRIEAALQAAAEAPTDTEADTDGEVR